MTDQAAETTPYCPDAHCTDCTPDPDGECCEATCGCCTAVNAADNCFLRPGDMEGTVSCHQHRMFDMLC